MADNGKVPKLDVINVHASRDGEQRIEVDALFNSIGDGAIMSDEFGRITRINPAALIILGSQEKDLLGKWFPKVIVGVSEDGEPVSLIDRPISKAFLTGKPISEKMAYVRKDGIIVPVALTVAPMMMGGRPVGAIEVFRDITLEHEIDRMKSEFISLASHQLRTPLSAVKTYSHMLLDGFMGPLEPAQSEALKTIITASNRMNELISTLLNITRIESGSISVTPKKINLSTLVEDIAKELKHSVQNKKLAMTLEVPTSPVYVRTDNLILKEIVSNLTTNAIKYTPEGGAVSIEVKLRKDKAIIAVTDTGIGIPKYAQNQIFSKFFRAPNVVKMETSGTGLGLYLVRGLADALGGKVWFESKEGEGSTFYFSIERYVATPKKVQA
jgi:PAS domain S-box-containing protein